MPELAQVIWFTAAIVALSILTKSPPQQLPSHGPSRAESLVRKAIGAITFIVALLAIVIAVLSPVATTISLLGPATILLLLAPTAAKT